MINKVLNVNIYLYIPWKLKVDYVKNVIILYQEATLSVIVEHALLQLKTTGQIHKTQINYVVQNAVVLKLTKILEIYY